MYSFLDLASEKLPFHLTPLDVCFAFLLVSSMIAYLVLNLYQSRVRTSRRIAPARLHVTNFGLWMVFSMGLVGIIGLRARMIYEGMGGDDFVGRPLGDEALIGFFALVVGVPVALAGSVYAVLLAYKSVELTERDRLDRQRGHFEKEVATICKNFLGIAYAIRKLNAKSAAAMEPLLREFNALGAFGQSQAEQAPFAAASRKLFASNANRIVSDAVIEFCDKVERVTHHAPSALFLGHLISKRSATEAGSNQVGPEGKPDERFLATRLSDTQSEDARFKFQDESSASLLAYGRPLSVSAAESSRLSESSKASEASEASMTSVAALLEVLEVMQLQAARLTSTDLVRNAILMNLNDAAGLVKTGEILNFTGATNNVASLHLDYFTIPTKQRDPDYVLHWVGRMLRDMRVQVTENGRLPHSGVIALGDVLLVDLLKMLPTKLDLMEFLKKHETAVMDSAWPEEGVEQLLNGIDYPKDAPVSKLAWSWIRALEAGIQPSRSGALVKLSGEEGIDAVVRSMKGDAADFHKAWVQAARERIMKVVISQDLVRQRDSASAGSLRLQVTSAKPFAQLERDLHAFHWHLLDGRLGDASGAPLDEVIATYEEGLNIGMELNLSREKLFSLQLEIYAVQYRHGKTPAVPKQGEALDWTEVMSQWVEGQAWRMPPVQIDGQVLVPEEVSATDGILPLILVGLGEALPVKPRFEPSGIALLGVVALPTVTLLTNPVPSLFVDAFDKMFAGLPNSASAAGAPEAPLVINAQSLFDLWVVDSAAGKFNSYYASRHSSLH